jgi:hypothetical protein
MPPSRPTQRNHPPCRRIRNAFAAAAISSASLICTPNPTTGAPPGNALEALNLFLAESAPTTPAYRADLQRDADPEHVPAGRLSGVSPLIGPFTYRPKTYAELTPVERVEILRDGRFHDFLLRRGRRFEIEPKDMLNGQPLAIQLSAP